jgi:hypothetical protein
MEVRDIKRNREEELKPSKIQAAIFLIVRRGRSFSQLHTFLLSKRYAIQATMDLGNELIELHLVAMLASASTPN